MNNSKWLMTFLMLLTLMKNENAFSGYVSVNNDNDQLQLLKIQGYMDLDLRLSLLHFDKQLTGFNLYKRTMLILDNPGGVVWTSVSFGNLISPMAEVIYKNTGRPLVVTVLNQCESMCVSAFVSIVAQARQPGNKHLQIRVYENAIFGFHAAANSNGIINAPATNMLINKLLEDGVSPTWLKKHAGLFSTTNLTYWSAKQLVEARSGLVLESEIQKHY